MTAWRGWRRRRTKAVRHRINTAVYEPRRQCEITAVIVKNNAESCLSCRLSGNCSTWNVNVSKRLTETLSRLQYPAKLLQSAIRDFIAMKASKFQTNVKRVNVCENNATVQGPDGRLIRAKVIGELSFENETDVRRKIGKIGSENRKIGSEIKPEEKKPPIINQQRVLSDYFQCNLCDTDYVRQQHDKTRQDDLLTQLSFT